jgi:hypothetical protein
MRSASGRAKARTTVRSLEVRQAARLRIRRPSRRRFPARPTPGRRSRTRRRRGRRQHQVEIGDVDVCLVPVDQRDPIGTHADIARAGVAVDDARLTCDEPRPRCSASRDPLRRHRVQVNLLSRSRRAGGRSTIASLGSELGNRAMLARVLEACAHLAAATGGYVEALRPARGAERLRKSAGRRASAAERVAMERWLRPAYAGLDDDAV